MNLQRLPAQRAARERAGEEFYRQLAFCYQKLGKSAEMKAALGKAAEIDHRP